jgi:hypothetical protein
MGVMRGATPDVIDARTRKIVTTLKDSWNLVSGSKFIEVHFRDGKVVDMEITRSAGELEGIITLKASSGARMPTSASAYRVVRAVWALLY